MATPYFQLRRDEVPSTQDLAREKLEGLPVLLVAASQTAGRGRSGSDWRTADRAVAVSFAFRHRGGDDRPLSLMAGLAAVRALPGTRLKWPNDVMGDGAKVGGILVERSGDVTVVGLGLNLWWSTPQPDATALFAADPGPGATWETGALWGAELTELIDAEGWDRDAYSAVCTTLGKRITWEPGGSGLAREVNEAGELVVESDAGVETLRSGAVRHVRG
ncbi:MAG TPA: biotin--[acetyl-CoA-carboxylase] ligase [Acidimicrobiia bacterium]